MKWLARDASFSASPLRSGGVSRERESPADQVANRVSSAPGSPAERDLSMPTLRDGRRPQTECVRLRAPGPGSAGHSQGRRDRVIELSAERNRLAQRRIETMCPPLACAEFRGTTWDPALRSLPAGCTFGFVRRAHGRLVRGPSRRDRPVPRRPRDARRAASTRCLAR